MSWIGYYDFLHVLKFRYVAGSQQEHILAGLRFCSTCHPVKPILSLLTTKQLARLLFYKRSLAITFSALAPVFVERAKMSTAKPACVSSSGTLTSRPIISRIQNWTSDYAAMVYLFFETLITVS